MDIKLPQITPNHSLLLEKKTNELSLKLHQQLDVKVTLSKIEKQTLTLQLAQSNKTLSVTSNLPANIKTGQTLQLLVSKLTPAIEFKILDKTRDQTLTPKQNPSNTPVLNTGNDKPLTLTLIPNTVKTITTNPQNPPTEGAIKKQRLPNKAETPQTLLTTPPLSAKGLEKQVTVNLTSQLLNTAPQLQPNNLPSEAKPLIKTRQLQQIVQETFKQVLPIQQQPGLLLNQIITNLRYLEKNKTISNTLKHLSREILDSLQQINDLKTPKRLKKALTHSGLFLEAKLTQKTTPAFHFLPDFKNQLLKLRLTLKQELTTQQDKQNNATEIQLIKELQQKTDSTLARTILNQLTSLPREDATKQLWVIDLPYINNNIAESVKIEISHNKKNNDNKKQENWTVTLTVTPPELATIHCQISCFDKTINTRFWSEDQQAVTKITDHLDYLKQQFMAAGINPGHMSAHTGKLTSETYQQIKNQSLFNQTA